MPISVLDLQACQKFCRRKCHNFAFPEILDVSREIAAGNTTNANIVRCCKKDGVVANIVVNRVVPGHIQVNIVSVSSSQRIYATAAIQYIVATATDQNVIPGPAKQRIVAVVGGAIRSRGWPRSWL